MWMYVVAVIAVILLLKELARLPTVGNYSERYVFITGCDTGFGNMLAKKLDSLGFNVFAGCFSERGADDLRKVSSARLKTVPLDVTKTASILKARKFIENNLPTNKGLWAIVNNAGVHGSAGVTEWFSKEDYNAVLDVNFHGVADVTRILLPLVRQARGRVVNIASQMGRIAAGNAPYAVSKYAVEAYSDCLRREVLKQGITVHILEPGYFKTDIVNIDVITGSLRRSFNNASPEVQNYYGRQYLEKVCEGARSRIENLASSDTHLVVDAYTHAVTAMFPRYRYLVGADCKYYFRPLWNLPEWITDKILAGNRPLPAGERQ